MKVLAWSLSAASILIAVLALGIAIVAALRSGSYRTLLTHQTLTPFITIGFACIGALIIPRRLRGNLNWEGSLDEERAARSFDEPNEG